MDESGYKILPLDIFKSDVTALFLNINIYNMQDITTFTTI